METANKVVRYRLAKVINGNGKTLQELIDAALQKAVTAGSRMQPLSGDAAIERLGINTTTVAFHIRLCELLCFQPGRKQATLLADDAQAAYSLEAIAASADPKERKEFVESIAYFGVIGNHVALVQSKTIRSKDVEDYLHWFLAATGVLTPEAFVILGDADLGQFEKHYAKAEVVSVRIGTPVSIHEATEGQAADSGAGSLFIDSTPLGVLRSTFSDDLNLPAISEDFRKEKIEMQVVVKVKGRKLSTESGHRFMSAIANATRHMEDRDFDIELKGLGTLSSKKAKKMLRPTKSIPVKLSESGGLIDTESMAAQIHLFLSDLLKTGEIRK